MNTVEEVRIHLAAAMTVLVAAWGKTDIGTKELKRTLALVIECHIKIRNELGGLS
jgi:hypothetical protein